MKTNLGELLNHILETNRAKEKAFSECEDDRDYFCHREIEAEKLAANAFEEAISDLIDSRIAKILNTQP